MTRSYFGSIQRLGPDRYRVWWTDKAGDRHSHRVRGRRSEAEAYLAARNLDGPPATITWEQVWHGYALPQIRTLSVKSQEEYERNWSRYLAPTIGREKVSDLTWKRANQVITAPESPSVQRQVGKLLKKLANMALRERADLLPRNPVDRAIEYAPVKHRRKNLVDVTQVGMYMEAARGYKGEAVILALMGFGMRPEEAEALTWEDVSAYSFKGSTYCTADIHKALTWTHTEGKVLKETKNESSERIAVCGEPWASRLLELAEGKSGPLCPSGKPYDPEHPEAWYTSPLTLAHNWQRWCERHGVPYVAPREMRSSYTTMMGEALVPDSVVEANVGHAGSTTKTRHYQRVTMRAKCGAADKLAELIEEVAG